MRPQIALINASTVVADDEAKRVVHALQTQVDRDFSGVWGRGAHLSLVPRGSKPKRGQWWLSILDDSDIANALGYHDITPEGLPLGKVFAGTDLKYGAKWSVTASHELLEMLGDPWINTQVSVDTPHGEREYAFENCDACEDDQYAYEIDGVLVSDFVTPFWFMPQMLDHPVRFDHQGHVMNPLQLIPGGYISYRDVGSAAGWQQEFAEGTPQNYLSLPPVGSRRERRRRDNSAWLTSEVAIDYDE